jgi:hypothetical protein
VSKPIRPSGLIAAPAAVPAGSEGAADDAARAV